MPSEQSPASNARPTGRGSTAKGQPPAVSGGVRGLLGLSMRESGLVPTVPLTAPPRGHHYGQPPLPGNEEEADTFREPARDELIDAAGRAGADPQSDFPSLPGHRASSRRAIPGTPADRHSSPTAMSVEQREHTSFVIPGVSTHRTEFAAVFQKSDTPSFTQPEESQEPRPDKTAPMHPPVSLPRTSETAVFGTEFFSRLEHFVIEGTKARKELETRQPSMMALSSSLVEQMSVPNGAKGEIDVVRRLAELQRVVSELAATVSSQTEQNRQESQLQSRQQKTSASQRMVIVKRLEGPPTGTPAFWDRSRLGRSYFRTR